MIEIKSILANIVLLFAIYTNAQSVDNVKTVHLNCYQEPLGSVLEKIRIQTTIDIIYSNDLVDNLTTTCRLVGCLVESALESILKRHNISFKIYNENTFVLFKVKKPVQKQYNALVVQQNYSDEDTSSTNSEPQMISRKILNYPIEAVRNKIEGDVTVKFFVTAEGNVKSSLVEQSSGSPILDSATVLYTQTLKYIPAYYNGKPRNMWISMKFKFFITNK